MILMYSESLKLRGGKSVKYCKGSPFPETGVAGSCAIGRFRDTLLNSHSLLSRHDAELPKLMSRLKMNSRYRQFHLEDAKSCRYVGL
jgi:hypothetical protein